MVRRFDRGMPASPDHIHSTRHARQPTHRFGDASLADSLCRKAVQFCAAVDCVLQSLNAQQVGRTLLRKLYEQDRARLSSKAELLIRG